MNLTRACGIGLVALLQLTIVGAAALIAVRVTNVAIIPAFGVAAILGDLFWFLLGFLFYATAYAAGASLVSRLAVRMAASAVPVWQVGLAVALTVASIVGLTWLAGRVYANAALRLGARCASWMRSVGNGRG